MRKIIFVSLLFFQLQLTFAQVFPYQKKLDIGSVPAMSIYNMVFDKQDNLYLTEMSRIVKIRDGKLLLDFKINIEDYQAGYDNNEGVYLKLVADEDQFIYILNQNKKRIEKHDQNGKFIKAFPPVGSTSLGIYLSIYLDQNNNINIFDIVSRTLFTYNSDGILIKNINLEDPDPIWDSSSINLIFDNQNNIYVAELKKYTWSPTAHITKLDQEGKIIQRSTDEAMQESGFNRPYSLAINIDKNGDIYAYNNGSVYTNTIDWPIVVFSPDGSLKKRLPVNALRGSVIQFDSQNNMYMRMAGSHGDYILKYDQEHKLIEQLGNKRRPYEVVFDSSDNFYMLDHVKSQLIKFNASGEEDKQFELEAQNLFKPLAVTVDDKGFIYTLEHTSGNKTSRVRKFDANGKLNADFVITTGSYDNYTSYNLSNFISVGLSVDKESNIYITAPNSGTHTILKLNQQGKEIAKIGPLGKDRGQVYRPLDLTLDAAGNIFVLDLNGKRIQKFSSSGKFIHQFGSFDKSEGDHIVRASIASDAFGNVLVAAQGFDKSGKANPTVKYFGLDGHLVFSAPINTPCLAMNQNGSLVAITDKQYDLFTIYGTSSSKEYNLIGGNLFHDENHNCTADESESSLANIIVKAEPGPYYGITDTLGNFHFFVGEGTYTIGALSEKTNGKQIATTCLSGNAANGIHFESYGNVSSGNNIGAKVTLTPYVEVSLSSNRRRRCMENLTTVSYANNGFAPAANAKVHVQFPPAVIFKSADVPHTRDYKGNYVFEVGTLQPGQRGIISIKDSVSCADPNIRGLTVCTKAWITPANTYPEPPEWNKADITLSAAEGDNNQARFVLQNNGQGDMADSLSFRLYEDQELMLTSKYLLAAGDSAVLRIPATGRVLRLEADQPEGHPIKKMASANLEITSHNNGLPDLAMMALPPDDPEPEITEDCLPIIDSFDPNDKQVVPAGLTSEFYTPTNTPLRYTVRFQNTGTDVAYRVVVVDTLSADVDMASFQVGAVSHNYRLSVSGKEKPVLTFTFDNIMLPDSSSDQAGSNGFIQFSVKPKAALPEKHLIENFADIFFDYNEPVRTNTIQNRIYDMPPEMSDRQLSAKDIIVSPAITSFSPTQSRAGQLVTIIGKNFSPVASANKVTFNGLPAKVQSASETELQVQVPFSAFSGKIKAVTPDGAATSNSDFVIFQPPTLISTSVNESKPGTVVLLNGTHFSPVATEDTVYFNGEEAKVLEATTTQLKVEVPATATKGKILLKTLGGQVESTQEFMVWHQPTITSFSPGKAKAGTTLTLLGINFSEEATRNSIKFGSTPAEATEATANSLVVKVPLEAQSGKIQVQTPGGMASTADDFTFIPAPVISSFSPSSGYAGTTVTILGKNFGADALPDVVLFNGIPATVTEASATTLVVQTPKGVRSGAVRIEGAGGEAEGEDFVVLELNKEDAISIYPNPNRGEITLNWFKANYKVEKVSLYDAVGKLLLQNQISLAPNDELHLKLTHFGPGIYTLLIQTSEGTVMKRVVVL